MMLEMFSFSSVSLAHEETYFSKYSHVREPVSSWSCQGSIVSKGQVTTLIYISEQRSGMDGMWRTRDLEVRGSHDTQYALFWKSTMLPVGLVFFLDLHLYSLYSTQFKIWISRSTLIVENAALNLNLFWSGSKLWKVFHKWIYNISVPNSTVTVHSSISGYMVALPSVIDIHTPFSSFAIVHSCWCKNSLNIWTA